MSNETPVTDQWMLDGDCKKCRRKNYCGETCKIRKTKIFDRIRDSLFSGFAEAFSKEKR